MIKQLIEQIKLNKVSKIIEILKNKDSYSKIKACKKIEKIKVTKKIGLFLIDSLKYNYGEASENDEIASILISQCFKNYYDEYSLEIKKIFNKTSLDTQNRILFLLCGINNESALNLYVDLILKYYKDRDFIPINNLFERPELYNILFPKLYKALRFKYIKNNILIVLNSSLNNGTVNDEDLKKNKRLIVSCINKVFNEGLKYNFSNTTKALQNKEYLDLRFFLEICVNIENYVSTKTTQKLLDELFKKNDNQLNLFILENYLKKGKNIKKLNLESIAKDDASRYPLFDLLDYYNMKDLFPVKYNKKQLLAKSDFYINFMIQTAYRNDIKNLKFLKKKVIGKLEYYIFKFKYTFEFKNVPNDYLTNYIIQTSGIEKYNNKKITKEFIGISGGYNLDKEPSKLEKPLKTLLYSKIDNTDEIDSVIDKLLDIKEEKEEKVSTPKPEKIKSSFFSYILIFLFFIFIVLLIGCVIYSYDPDAVPINHEEYKISELNKKYKFNEINGSDIFNLDDPEYYVLFYKNNKKNKNEYYTFINQYLENNIKVYYVNMNDSKNDFLKNVNQYDFVVGKDKFMKVVDKEFEYYVDGKDNILKEMKNQVNIFNKEKNKK